MAAERPSMPPLNEALPTRQPAPYARGRPLRSWRALCTFQQGASVMRTTRNISIILALLAVCTLAVAAHPAMVRGAMDLQWPPFQGLPVDTYGQRLWAVSVWYATFFAPIVGGCIAFALLDLKGRSRSSGSGGCTAC